MGTLKESWNSYVKVKGGNQSQDELTCVMGSPPQSVQQFLQALERKPDQITWSAERRATLCKGPQGKLGFSVKTYRGKKSTYTVILKVKPDCDIRVGQLKRFDRITSIDNYDITHDVEQHILNILAAVKNSEIALTVCRPVKFKLHASNLQSPVVVHSDLDERKIRSLDNLLNVEESNTSITFKSWNSVGSESLNLQELSNPENNADELSAVLNETSFNVNVGQKDSGQDKGNNNIPDDVNDGSKVNVDRTISNSSLTDAPLDTREFIFKRGISQVSGSDSNKSQSSLKIEHEKMRRREKTTKTGKDHKTTKFVKTGSIENTDEEIEPLNAEETLTPPTVGKLDKYSHFNVDDRSFSMPTTVSVADIVVEDPTLSLPLGYSNVGMTPIHASTCQCPMCIPGSDQRVCSKCAAQKTKLPSPSVSLNLTDSQTASLSEEHGHMILQTPQYAVWDGKNTHVVEIDKGQSKGFGFSYKVKVGKNQDASVETYTLVDNVEKDGPSKEKLHVGDWVRSVNGTPIQNFRDAFGILTDSKKQKSIRLVIQRPVRLSQSQQTPPVEREKTVQDLNPPSPQSPSGARDQDPLIPGTIAPKKETEKPVIPPNIYVIDSSAEQSSAKSVLPPFPKTVKLPKVRIFVCGNEAMKCANYLLKDSVIDIESQSQCYTFTSCSMSTDCFGNILISQPCSNLFATSMPSVRSSPVHLSDQRGGGDSRCRQCGGELQSPVVSPNVPKGNTVNVELFAVPDDRFFHFCCSYLLTQSSIFILTFDASKLLRSAANEFSRLQNLSHTIRSFAGEDSQIMLCGFIDGAPDSSSVKDEVGALFYTPLHSVLQNFNVSAPELVSTHPPNSASDNLSENQLLQSLWKVVTETVQRQQVLQPSLLLIDHLVSLREKEFILTESQLMEIIQGKLPNYQLDVHQVILTCLIENREILLGKASSFINSKFHRQIESLILLDPQSLLSCLQRIITMVTEDKQNWLKTHSTGFVKISSFLELCQTSDKHKQFIADFMECNGIIVKKPGPPNGGSTSPEYFFPYFAVPSSMADKPVVESREYELYLKFVDPQSSQMYYALLFTIAANCDVPSSFSVHDVQTCVFQHIGYQATAYHQKVYDRVHFVFKREDKMGGSKPVELFSWLQDICHAVLDSLYVSFILGAPCPRMENCSRTTATGIHVIDLRDKKSQYCDNERIDTMKPIRMWKQKDCIVQEPTVLNLGSRSNKSQKLGTSLLDLPHSVMHNVCSRLRIPSELGRDWKGLAGLMGYTAEDVQMMASLETLKEDPVRALLHDWTTTYNGKIDDLITMLEEMNMENVLTYLRQSLPQSSTLNSLSSPTATQNSVVSFQSVTENSEYPECSGLSGQVLYQRSKVTETEVMPLNEEGQGHSIRLNNLDGGKIDNITGSANQAITPVETTMDLNGILKS